MFDLTYNIDLSKKRIGKVFPVFCGLLASLLSVTLIILIDKLLDYISPQLSKNLSDLHAVEVAGIVFSSVIISPLLETLLFQLLIIENMRGFKNINSMRVIIISTAAFSCAHLFFGSPGQALRMIVLGAVLSVVYMRMRRCSIGAAFTATWSAHCAHNILILIIAWNYQAVFKS